MFNIFSTSQTFFWLLGLMSGIFSIRGTSRSTGFKTKTCLILVIFILSKRSNLYVTSPRTFKILKGFNLVKSNLLLGLVVQINIIFVLGVFCKKIYFIFFFKSWSLNSFFISELLHSSVKEY